MKHNYSERKKNRKEWAEKHAAKNEQKAGELFAQAKKMSDVIPFGQPILVGHHSENSDRNYRNKIHNTFGKAFEAEDKAAYYADKAETIENNTAIFSDDPEALQKLKTKLESLQAAQLFMKEANKCLKKKDKAAFMLLKGATEEIWQVISTPNFMNQIGFRPYALQNNNANISQVKKRIDELQKKASLKTSEFTIADVRVVSNIEANRLQLFFPTIPDEKTRTTLKKNGFRWCRSEGAWQRHLTPNALFTAKYFLQDIITGNENK